MSTDDPQKALPEPTHRSASTDNDNIAIRVATDAVKEWNSDRQAEIRSARALEKPDIQDNMAAEIFNAVLDYLKPLPRSIQVRVIAKFKAINLPSER